MYFALFLLPPHKMDRHSVLPPLVTLIITDKKWSFRTHVRPVDLQAIGDFICRFPTSPSIIIIKKNIGTCFKAAVLSKNNEALDKEQGS